MICLILSNHTNLFQPCILPAPWQKKEKKKKKKTVLIPGWIFLIFLLKQKTVLVLISYKSRCNLMGLMYKCYDHHKADEHKTTPFVKNYYSQHLTESKIVDSQWKYIYITFTNNNYYQKKTKLKKTVHELFYTIHNCGEFKVENRS